MKNLFKTQVSRPATLIIFFLSLSLAAGTLLSYSFLQKPEPFELGTLPQWYILNVERKRERDWEANVPGVDDKFIRIPLMQAMGRLGEDISYSDDLGLDRVKSLRADVENSSTQQFEFEGLFYLLWAGRELEEKDYENEFLRIEVKKLRNKELIPYLQNRKYCEYDRDCMERILFEECCVGVFNNYKRVIDRPFGCPSLSVCGLNLSRCADCEVEFGEIKCVENECRGFDVQIISIDQ